MMMCFDPNVQVSKEKIKYVLTQKHPKHLENWTLLI